MDKVVTDEEPLQPPKPHEVRIGLPRRHFWENVDPEIKQAAEKFLRKLEYAGFQVVDDGQNIDGFREFAEGGNFSVPAGYETFKQIKKYLILNDYDDLSVQDVIKQIKTTNLSAALERGLKNPISAKLWEDFILNKRTALLRNSESYFSR